jgi:membrane-bound metal-dependent hydrolase YbcI (DUF457 family)
MRVTLCTTAVGIIGARAFTHSIIVALATCLVLGLIAGALLRLYAGTRR